MPTPIARSALTPVPVSSMDCIRRGDSNTLDADDQRFSAYVTGAPDDAKLLWSAKLIPIRTIRVGFGGSLDVHIDTAVVLGQLSTGDPTIWNSNDYSDGFNRSAPFWGGSFDYAPGLVNGINLWPGGSLIVGANDFWAWSHWSWGVFSPPFPNHPIGANGNPPMTKVGVVSQIICPDAFNPVPFELWTVTVRALVGDPAAGDPLDVPSPYPWSHSNDFVKVLSGTLNPGDVFTIPCPIGNSQPESPPAPGSFADPTTYGAWIGWGFATFIYFPPK